MMSQKGRHIDEFAGRGDQWRRSGTLDGNETNSSEHGAEWVGDGQGRGRNQEKITDRLPRVLRSLGGTALFASALTFTIQTWMNADSISRYFVFLAFTSLLAGAGVFCGLRNSDGKAARLLFGLVAAFLPAHFAQLGALLYSLTHPQNPYMPAVLVFNAPSPLAVVVTIGIALFALVPIIYTAFSVLIRSEALHFTILYFAINGLLLIPCRAGSNVTLLTLLAFVVVVLAEARCFWGNKNLRNVEGAFCRVIMFAPIGVLMGRTLFYYEQEVMLLGTLFIAVGIHLFFVLSRLTEMGEVTRAIQLLGTLGMVIGWRLFAAGLLGDDGDSIFDYPRHALWYPVVYLPMTAILFGLSTAVDMMGKGYRDASIFIGVGAMFLQVFFVDGVFSAFLLTVVGLLSFVSGYVLKERLSLTIGALGFAFGLIYHLRCAVDSIGLSPWSSLAILGLGIILLASYLERVRLRLSNAVEVLRNQIKWRQSFTPPE